MRLGVLFSGGKDSTLALYKAMKDNEIACLISVQSKNPESYMFHTPNINLVEHQAKALILPLIITSTKGEKEKELKELETAIAIAKSKYNLDGIVTGAVASVYQASRIQAICEKLDLKIINPLWHEDQVQILREIIKDKFKVLIIGVFGEGMDKFLGKEIDEEFITEIIKSKEKYGINPAGEGGEFESFVLNGPIFHKSLSIKKSHFEGEIDSRIMVIDSIIVRE